MAEDAEETKEGADTPKGRGKGPLLIGLVLALAGAGGGYYAVGAGLLPFGAAAEAAEAAETPAGDAPEQNVAFVPLEPIIVSLPSADHSTHLRMRAEIEVAPGSEADVSALAPRIMDVLNGYLRAVDVSELRDRAAYPRLRAQMLRRVQVVAGPEAVRNLLITEFVLN